MTKLGGWLNSEILRQFWAGTLGKISEIPVDPDSEGADSSSTTVLEHQKCKTVHYESFWRVGAIWIVMPLQFSSFQFLAWRTDLLRKHKGIIPLRPFLQLDHARKSSSGGQNPSDFFLRLRICLVLNALRPACSQYCGVELHQAFYLVYSYEHFFWK